jgi:hypothetical protein
MTRKRSGSGEEARRKGSKNGSEKIGRTTRNVQIYANDDDNKYR